MAGRLATAIVAAAGSGSRMGTALPKQYILVNGIPVVARTIQALATSALIDEVVVAVPPGHEETFQRGIIERYALSSLFRSITVVQGGLNRQASVGLALDRVSGRNEIVLVHDAARPMVEASQIEAVIAAASEYGAAACGVPPVDTVKSVACDGFVENTLDRDHLVMIQTPQAFKLPILRQAYESARRDGFTGTDDCSLVERLGLRVAVTPGSRGNIKITERADLRIAEALTPEGKGAACTMEMIEMRIGQGYDVHRLAAGRDLVLGGVRVPFEAGLLGHSDGDVLVHAVCDAILGAMALGDIGTHFPDTDPEYLGCYSIALLEKVSSMAAERGLRIVNVDSTVVAERPRIAPYVRTMCETMAKAMNMPESCVNIKGKTTEGLGFEGTGEGMAAMAVALLSAIG
ncbi:MAG: 2-C-methyl-D-erythritol 4-phosphate cytidylyltransferase [Clostridia bacterium]|nr:2-C-methyl-D-erythritol 4-phosphate cytidylyltransferase [Clostridia bacterium]